MATSGSFTSGRYGNSSTGPYLTLDWSRTAVDIPNNRSKLKMTLKLHSNYSLNFSASKSGVIQGNSFTYTGGFSGTGSVVLREFEWWANHAADGTLGVTFSASFNINITWSGASIGTMSISGTGTVDTIPRASTFTALSINTPALTANSARTLNYTINRASSAFSHYCWLYANGVQIKHWQANGTGAMSTTLTAAECNNILATMPSSTALTLEMQVQTFNISNGANIGGRLIGRVGITVATTVLPTVTGLTAAIAGSGRDKTIGKYVQNVSKLTASFTSGPSWGAKVTNTYIAVRRQSDQGNWQTIQGTSGTTAGVLTLAGVYDVIGVVEDSRGRRAEARIQVTVQAYNAPRITTFTASRNRTTTTTVNASFSVSWSALSTSNPASIQINGTASDGGLRLLYDSGSNTTGAVSASPTFTGQADTSSHTYVIVVSDSFGKSARSEVRVSTSFVELSIAKGYGIGVGKVHERGALDVTGNAYFSGTVYLSGDNVPVPRSSNGSAIPIGTWDLNLLTTTGQYHGNSLTNGPVAASTGSYWYVEVVSNSASYVYQRAVNFHDSLSYERRNVGGTWHAWRRVNFNTFAPALWTGASMLVATDRVTPSKAINECAHGWLLMWSQYNGGTIDSEFVHTFIPKTQPRSARFYQLIAVQGAALSAKYLSISNTQIIGHDHNMSSVPQYAVLRNVYEW